MFCVEIFSTFLAYEFHLISVTLLMVFQPWYARLEDAFDDIDIKTEEGDLDDGFDYEGEEVGINVLMKTNRFVKNIYFVLNSSQTMGKIIFRSRDSTSRPCGRLSRTEWCLVRGVACCWGGYYVRVCTVPDGAKEKLFSASRENELFTNKSTKNNENTRKQT